jgi:hypothetical protein
VRFRVQNKMLLVVVSSSTSKLVMGIELGFCWELTVRQIWSTRQSWEKSEFSFSRQYVVITIIFFRPFVCPVILLPHELPAAQIGAAYIAAHLNQENTRRALQIGPLARTSLKWNVLSSIKIDFWRIFKELASNQLFNIIKSLGLDSRLDMNSGWINIVKSLSYLVMLAELNLIRAILLSY